MPKRKELTSHNGAANDDSDSDSDFDMLDIEFEWFDPQPANDFHGLKTLCRQLFDMDNEFFDLSALVDIILEQPLLGSTVKADGNESDPFAFLTVINLWEHRDKPVIKSLVEYLHTKVGSNEPLASALRSQVDPSNNTRQVGLILTERLVNMPAQVISPMYKFLIEEMQWALEEKEAYNFTDYIILSKVYVEMDSKLDAQDSRPAKKSKKDKSGNSEIFYFHPEDEALTEMGFVNQTYPWTKEAEEGASDAKRAFTDAGIETKGHVTLVPAPVFAEVVDAMTKFLSDGTIDKNRFMNR